MAERLRIKLEKLRSDFAAIKEECKNLKLSERKWKRKLMRLQRRFERRESRDRRRRERRRRLRDKCVQDILATLGSLFYPVLNDKHQLLWYQSNFMLQQLTRNVLDEVACRWAKKQGVPVLDRFTVKVRDNKAILPREVEGSMDHADAFYTFVFSVYGPAEDNRVLQDFYRKLTAPGLTLPDFQNLYFHKFLQSHEDITNFPAVAVANLRIMTNVSYQRRDAAWELAYQSWVEIEYPGKEIHLANVCSQNDCARRVYAYRQRGYEDNPIDEADLVRNFVMHFNENRPAGQDTFDSLQIGGIVFDLFPHIGEDLYDFMFECGVNMDFSHVRTFYEIKKEAADSPDRWVPT